MIRYVLTGCAALGLAACTQTTTPPPAPPPGAAAGVTPSAFRLPEGAGCSGEIARFRAVLANDVETGHLTRTVYGRAGADLDRAASACTAGRDGEARATLAATRSRYGYP